MSKWKIDPDHSVAAFKVRHMMGAYVHGQCNKLSGEVNFDPADISKTSVALEIDVAGIYTGIQKRDDHLRSEEFFDVNKYPKMTFKSSKAERTGFNACKVTGDLSIHGITRPVTIEVDFFGPVKSPFGDTTMGLTGKVTINREDFGLTWNVPMDNGGLIAGKEVKISMNIETDLVS
ncbi:MAG: YceI family protein [Nitrospirae bacterium]|nr:YceI family protein [Nitrospirota bacterium]